MKRPSRQAVFIDKDGALVADAPYHVDARRLRFSRNALVALRQLDQAGYALIVVTHQPGLASGQFTMTELAALRRTLVGRIRDEAGVDVAGFYACPHAPGIHGEPRCGCRKPMPGLLRAAALVHCLDLEHCWMVGDILNDVEAGRRAGCRTVMLDVGNETEWRITPLRTPHFRCADLLDAAQFIVASEGGELDARPLPRMVETR